MNTTTFINTRQQAGAAVLALCLSLGMLFSVDLLATQPAPGAQMAAATASGASSAPAVNRTGRARQG
jgi:hypothetical protein